jgi:drug/metabolite transporter (DMT)-like permease
VRRSDTFSAILLVLMWSSGFVGAELGTRFAPADTLLGWRYVVATVLLVTWVVLRGVRPDRHTWPRLALVGLLCQCLYLGGVVTGVGMGVPAGTAALVAALQPLVVAVGSGPLLGDPTSRRQRVGLGLGVVGVALVVSSDLGAGAAGLLAYALVVGGMLGLSAGTLLERRMRLPVPLIESLTVQTLTAAVFFVSVAAVDGHLAPPAEPGFWWSVAWVVGLSTFGGYGSYLLVLRRSGATRVSTLLFLTPPVTALWAFAMFGTRPGLLAIPGAAVCALSVWLVMRRQRSSSLGHRPRRDRQPPDDEERPDAGRRGRPPAVLVGEPDQRAKGAGAEVVGQQIHR